MAASRGGDIEVFLDETPGETRGVIVRDGSAEHLLIQRRDDPPATRLGARSLVRIDQVMPGLKAAFAVFADGGPGFLPLRKDLSVHHGQKIEVEVVAEARDGKGPTLRWIRAGEGEPRLLAAGPTISQQLTAMAPGVEVQIGADAIQAGWDAEEEALASGTVHRKSGLDLSMQRTRALVAVDLDHAPTPGRDAKAGRLEVNLLGVRETGRLLRLKRWGGLVAIDLVGTGMEAEPILKAVRQAFSEETDVVIGPLNRFGVLMLSTPWRRTPIEGVLLDAGGRRSLDTRALDVVRRLKFALLSDTRSPRLFARCTPQEADRAAAWVAELGPRAHLRPDPAAVPGRCVIEEA